MRREEVGPVLVSGLFFFCVLTALMVLRPAREALGMQRGIEAIRWLFVGTVVLTLLVNPLFGLLVSRFRRLAFIGATYLFFALGLLGFYARPTFVRVGPIDAAVESVHQTRVIVSTMVTGLGQIITGKRSVKELGGPLKIAQYSGESLSQGPLAFVYFVAIISINLGFINLLPIPALDGGHLAFYAAEAVRRKPVGARSQEWAFRTGLAFVLALMLFVTFNDIASLPIFGS